ncbi:Aste57867_14932 [Aphanomyces stellatus]|uniref:Aste57867_14932 protein n=1 Tax=Aphanomyces stellatus TaxID=120398 RepID=A0A485L2I3_9STRA|nr:hypothetical protein As57867_014876 [Aphanomyces stellatus]VFT91747.1 Aste57867_14932 [Aphanomyces stellatus]
MITRQLHGSGDEREEPAAMILLYTVALAMSAGMSMATCATVFKWADVMRDAGHGTMFMAFVCMCLWSISSLMRIIAVYLNDRDDTLANRTILNLSIPTEVFYNAASFWFALIAYEIQRRALRPRTASSNRTAMIWYTAVIFGAAAVLLASLFVLDCFNVIVDDDDEGIVEQKRLVRYILEHVSWVTQGIRSAAVLYAGGMALWLYRKRGLVAFEKLPRALLGIVTLFFLLNVPDLIVDPLCDFKVIDTDVYPFMPSVVKFIKFSVGGAISLLMGGSVAGFDVFFHVARPRSRLSPATSGNSIAAAPQNLDFFVISDASPTTVMR